MKYSFYPEQIVRLPLKPLKTSFTTEELVDLFSNEELQEALYISSPALLEEFKRWKEVGCSDSKKEEKLFISLLKYALRMHSRCTPYGLNASCGVTNSLSFELDTSNYYRKTRLDMNYLCELIQSLSNDPSLLPYLMFYPNNTCYEAADKLRYVEYRIHESNRIHQLASVDNSEYLARVFSCAESGATIKKLIEAIIDDKENIYSRPSKCGYNPYQGLWINEDGYIPVKDWTKS